MNVESTSGRFHSVFAAYSASKWIGFVFIVSSVNQTLSASSTVGRSGFGRRPRPPAPRTCDSRRDHRSDARARPRAAARRSACARPGMSATSTWGSASTRAARTSGRSGSGRTAKRTVAWSWLKGDRGLLEFDVIRDRLDLLDEILAEPDATHRRRFADDEEMLAALPRHGFTRRRGRPHPGSVLNFLARDLPEAPEPPPLPDGFRYRTVEPDDSRARRDPPRRLGAVACHRGELRERPGLVAVPRVARLRRRGAGRTFRRVCASSGRTTRTASASSSRSAYARSFAGAARRRRLHVRPAPPARRGRPRGDRLLRDGRSVRALRVARLPPPRLDGRPLALTLLRAGRRAPTRADSRRRR